MKHMTVTGVIGIGTIALFLTAAAVPGSAHGARLYFKDGDYIEGQRVYGKRGDVYLEVVRGAGGTLVYGLDEVDLGRTFPASAKPEKRKQIRHDNDQPASSQPLIFSDANTPGRGAERSVGDTADANRDTSRNEAKAAGQPAGREPSTPHSGLTVQIQGGGQVGFLRTISDQEKSAIAKNQDNTRYFGRIEKDGTATFTNHEGHTLRGYIGDDGLGSVMDEQRKMIKIEPRP